MILYFLMTVSAVFIHFNTCFYTFLYFLYFCMGILWFLDFHTSDFEEILEIRRPTQSRMQIHCTCHTKYRKSIKQLRHSHFLNPAVESIGWQTPSRMQMYCTCHTKYKKSMESLYHSHLSRRAANSSWERQAAPHHDSQWFLIRIHKFNTSSKEPR